LSSPRPGLGTWERFLLRKPEPPPPELVFEGYYSLETLCKLTKSIDRPSVTLKFVLQERGAPKEAGPLVLRYALGDAAYLRWIIAPVLDPTGM
jgi:hypothetical protein